LRTRRWSRGFPVRGIPLTRTVHCRSYLAAPLVGMEGGIGTLRVLSPKPNQFTEQHASILGVLARQVMMRLEYFGSFEGTGSLAAQPATD